MDWFLMYTEKLEIIAGFVYYILYISQSVRIAWGSNKRGQMALANVQFMYMVQ
jgi:hypothetical protein